MPNLIYLICSLPSLSFGQRPPISLKEFKEDAKKQLSDNQFQRLELTNIRGTEEDWEKGKLGKIGDMLNELQQDRIELRNSRRQHRTPEMINLDKKIVELNPLEREKHIMQWVWEVLDDIESNNTFSFTAVMVYKMKLQILHRLNSFDAERGAKLLEAVVNPTKNEKEGWLE